jgi:two-component system response regulator YesN
MKYRAILIDDEPWTRDVVKALGHWNELGIAIVGEASDGAAGMELVEQLAPDIVITDVKMPRFSGLQLAKALHEKHPDTKVIVVSGYDDYEFVHSAMQSCVFDYLLKPVKESELNERLAACTARIGETRRSGSGGEVFSGGLRDREWAKRFEQLRQSLCDLLVSGDRGKLTAKFDALKALLRDEAEIGEQVSVYYRLLDGLQKYLEDSGCTVGEVFGEQGLSFVFGPEGSFGEMLEYLCGAFCQAAETVERLTRRRGRLDIERIKSFIDDNYTAALSLEDVAGRFYVSREYLSRCFKAEVGCGFNDYLIARRM